MAKRRSLVLRTASRTAEFGMVGLTRSIFALARGLGPERSADVGAAIARRIPSVGWVTVSLRKSIITVPRARRLNPLMLAWTLNNLGFASYFAGQYEQAIEALEKSGAPSLETKVFKALTYGQLGRKEDAAREVEAILEEMPDFTARGWIANDIMEPGGSSEARFLEGARKAGLPIDKPGPTN